MAELYPVYAEMFGIELFGPDFGGVMVAVRVGAQGAVATQKYRKFCVKTGFDPAGAYNNILLLIEPGHACLRYSG